MNVKRMYIFSVMTFLVLLLTACGGDETKQEQGSNSNESDKMGNKETQDVANVVEEEVLVSLKDAAGDVVAVANLTQEDDYVKIKLEGQGLSPGEHGFHIHETGECKAPDFTTAGGHYNPEDTKHGKEHHDGSHAGDLRNIEVAEDGTVNTEIIAEKVSLKNGELNSVFKENGTALVIHAGADDYASQPSGDAGDRIACGVIGG